MCVLSKHIGIVEVEVDLNLHFWGGFRIHFYHVFSIVQTGKKNVQGNCLEMDKPYVTMQTRAKIIHLCIHIHLDTPSYSHIVETLDGNEP